MRPDKSQIRTDERLGAASVTAGAARLADSRDDARALRLGSALTGMARDLASARRELTALRRENAALRSRLEAGCRV